MKNLILTFASMVLGATAAEAQQPNVGGRRLSQEDVRAVAPALEAYTQQNLYGLSSDAKRNTPCRFAIGLVDQDLRECCHAGLFASAGWRKRSDRGAEGGWPFDRRHRQGGGGGPNPPCRGSCAETPCPVAALRPSTPPEPINGADGVTPSSNGIAG